ncbi:MAG: hypothetical protein V3R66_03775, partial [Rhodospirillales bacterium]
FKEKSRRQEEELRKAQEKFEQEKLRRAEESKRELAAQERERREAQAAMERERRKAQAAMDQERLNIEKEKLRLQKEMARSSQQLASLPPASFRPAITLPAPSTERVRFGTVKLMNGWTYARQLNGDKDGVFKRDDLFTTDRLLTKDKGALHGLFDDEAMLRIGQTTDVAVESFGPSAETGEPSIALSLKMGVMRFLAGDGNPPVTATIRTPAALMRIKSTDFVVEVIGDKSTRLMVSDGEGSIASTRGGPAVDVKPGYFLLAPRDEAGVIVDRAPSISDKEGMVMAFQKDYGLTEKARDPRDASGGSEGHVDDGYGDDGGGDGH